MSKSTAYKKQTQISKTNKNTNLNKTPASNNKTTTDSNSKAKIPKIRVSAVLSFS